MDRGWILNSYAQIEYMMADTVIRSVQFPAYEVITAGLPYRLSKRLDRFNKLIESDGPLDAFRDELRVISADFEATEERRHFLVHGKTTALIDPSDAVFVEFERFTPSKFDPFRRSKLRLSLPELAQLRVTANLQADAAMQMFRRLHKHFGWYPE